MNSYTGYVDRYGVIRPGEGVGYLSVKITAWGNCEEPTLRARVGQVGARVVLKAAARGDKSISDMNILVGFDKTPALNLHPQGGEDLLKDVLSQREVTPLYSQA